MATPRGWEYAVERIEAGAACAGRRLADLRLTAWLYTCLDDDEERALDAIRPMAATSLVTSRPVLADLGIEMPAGFASAMEARGWSLASDVVTEAAAVLPDELVRRFGLAGTPDTCRAALRELLDAFPQISQVTIVPFAPAGGTVDAVVRRFIYEVALEPARWS